MISAVWRSLRKLTRPTMRLHIAAAKRIGRWIVKMLEDEDIVFKVIGFAVIGLGFLLLVNGLVNGWYDVPVGIHETSDGHFVPETKRANLAPTMHGIVAIYLAYFLGSLASMIVGVLQWPWETWRIRVSLAAMSLCVAILAFPAATINWDTSLAAHAAWMQDQHYNLTWLGGDVYNNQEGSDDLTKSGMIFAGNPLRTGIHALPDRRGAQIRLSNLDHSLEWFGYGLSFTQFESKGWLLSVIGCLLIVCGQMRCGMVTRKSRRVLRRVLFMPSILAALVIAAVLIPLQISAYHFEQARLHHAWGRFEESLEELDTAARWLPSSRQHSQFIAQRGYLLLALDRVDEPEAQLVMAIEREARGILAEAEATYWSLLRSDPGQPVWHWQAWKREAYRALIRAGLEDFNGGQLDAAHQTFCELLVHCPHNLKVAVALQFTELQLGNAENCERLAAYVQAIYSTFDSLEKRSVLSAVYENTARAYFMRGDGVRTAEFHRRAIKGK